MRSFALAVLLATSPQGVTAPIGPVLELSDVGHSVPGLQITGANPIDRSGLNVRGAGDVNGDGVEDFLVSAIIADPPGRLNAGIVHLIFGDTAALGISGELSLGDLNGVNGVRFHGLSAGDQLGIGITGLGDFNGDGDADIAMSTWRADPNGRTDAGTTYVVYGGPNRFNSPTFNLAALDGTNGFRAIGRQAHDNSGLFIAGAGDINADGLDDLLIGATRADTALEVKPGESYLIYGTREPISGGLLDLLDLDGANGVRFIGPQVADFAASVAGLGDVNADGIGDFAIGARATTIEDRDRTGAVYVIYGRRGPYTQDGSFTLGSLDPTVGAVITGAEAKDFLGQRVAGPGDVNGDGIADIIIGAPFESAIGIPEPGATYVIFGNPNGLGESGTVHLADLTSGEGIEILGETDGDVFGITVSGTGDINGDGFCDFIVGAQNADPEGRTDAGESFLVLGNSVGAGPGGSFMLSDLSSPEVTRFRGEAAGDYSGNAVAGAGDVDADGVQDILIGAYHADVENIDEAGRTYLIYGRAFRSETSYSSFLPSVMAPPEGIGHAGTDSASIPPSRCEVGFTGGEGPGNAGASLQRVVFTDPDFGLQNFGPRETIADIVWYVTTDRADWVSGEVVFHYLDREIPGLDESRLCLYTAPGPFGPWVHVPGAAFDAIRNRVAAPVTRLGLFLIAQAPRASDADSASVLEVLLGQRPEHPVFDLNGDRKINVADLLEGL